MTPSRRVLSLLGLAVTLWSLNACAAPTPTEPPPTPPTMPPVPSATASATLSPTPRTTRIPPTAYPTDTITPTATSANVSNLLSQLRGRISAAPEYAIDPAVWDVTPTPRSGVDLKTPQNDTIKVWAQQWLSQLTQTDLPDNLRLDEYQINRAQQQPQVVYNNTQPDLAANVDFDLRPPHPEDTLWRDDLLEPGGDGWVRHYRLWFMFARRDNAFVLQDISIYRPFDFEFALDAAEFKDMPDDQIADRLMRRWFESYMNTDVPSGYQLDGFTIDSIKLETQDDWGSKYTVTFSLDRTMFQSSSYQWGNGTFAGHFEDGDENHLHNLLRYVGIRHEDQRIIFKSLDRTSPKHVELPPIQRSAMAADTPEELARVLMQHEMSGKIVPEQTSCWKIVDYRIDKAAYIDFWITPPPDYKEDILFLSVDYSIRPFEPHCSEIPACPGLACEGEWEDPWVTRMNLLFYVIRAPDTYTLLYTYDGCCMQAPWIPWATPEP